MQRKPVSYWRLFRQLGLYWALFPLFFALVFGTVGISMAREAALLAREGVVTEALVLEKQIERRRSSDGNDSTSYFLRYTYRPEERAEPVTRRQGVSRTFHDRVQVGDQIPVTYAWSRPERASVDVAHDRLGAWIFGGFGTLAALVALGLGTWMIGRKLSILRALRHGEVRQARVSEIRATNVQKNKRTQYVLHWTDAKGNEGKSMMADFSRLAAHPAGSVIVVYVDPKTGRGWWEEQI